MFNARRSTPLNQPSKREKSNGFCSRVSTTIRGRGVLSCVPPRSARTGMAGGGTGFALRNHSSGELIRVRRRFIAIGYAATFSSRYSWCNPSSTGRAKAQKHGLIPCKEETNPVNWVEQSGKSHYKAVIVSPEQAFKILMVLPP